MRLEWKGQDLVTKGPVTMAMGCTQASQELLQIQARNALIRFVCSWKGLGGVI